MEFLDLECEDDDTRSERSARTAGKFSSISTDLSGWLVSEGSISDGESNLSPKSHSQRVSRQSSNSVVVRRALPRTPKENRSSSSDGAESVVESARGRAYVFTWNSYSASDEDSLRIELEGGVVRYCCYGRERAPTTGRNHLQGVIYFAKPRRFGGVKRWFANLGGHDVHIEPMRGTIEQAIAYCKKDGDFFEHGTAPKYAGSRKLAGKREKDRWKSIRATCENQQFANLPDDFVCRYPGNPQRIFQLSLASKAPKERDDLENYWLWGETGTGKSRSARAWCRAKGYSLYLKDATKWWDNYSGEHVALIEEFGPEEAKALGQLLKRWTDHYPFPGEIKCAPSRPMRPPIVIVTSNYSIEELFPLSRDYEPFLRRFRVYEFVKDKPNPFFDV